MHVFLTGEIQIGKSTVLRKTLSLLSSPRLAGFRTLKPEARDGGKSSVYIFPYAEENPAAGEFNRVGICNPGCGQEVFSEIFDARGVEILRGAEGAELIIMDEVGKMEAASPKFCARVRELIEGSTPILGVVRKSGATPLQELIKHHGAVRLVEITEANRDAAPEQIAQLIKYELCKRIDSAGAIVYEGDGAARRLLMLENGGKGWSFPKGHIEPGESAEEAAVRETLEETGLQVELLPDFCAETASGRPGEERKIFYFIGRAVGGELRPEAEGYALPAWVRADEAASLLRFPQDEEPLTAALEYLGEK
ncbi:MAG: NUDIX domain-containing protein [Clostridiales bacterium]|nr:NUDIX domain-containing protein [Clostridiales bacterium]